MSKEQLNEIISVYDFNEPNGQDIYYIDRNIISYLNDFSKNSNEIKYKLNLIKNKIGNRAIINPLLCFVESYSKDNPNNICDENGNYQFKLEHDHQNLKKFFARVSKKIDNNQIKFLLDSPNKIFNHDFITNFFSSHLNDIKHNYSKKDYKIRLNILRKAIKEELVVDNVTQISSYMLYMFIYALYGNQVIRKVFHDKITSNAFFDFFYGSFLFLFVNAMLKYNLETEQKFSSINFITFDKSLQKLFQIMPIKDVIIPLEERKNYPGSPEAKFELPKKEYLTQCYDEPIPKKIGEKLLYTDADPKQIDVDNYTEYDFLSDYCREFNLKNTCNHLIYLMNKNIFI